MRPWVGPRPGFAVENARLLNLSGAGSGIWTPRVMTPYVVPERGVAPHAASGRHPPMDDWGREVGEMGIPFRWALPGGVYSLPPCSSGFQVMSGCWMRHFISWIFC